MSDLQGTGRETPCANCRWFQPTGKVRVDGVAAGECRRSSPGWPLHAFGYPHDPELGVHVAWPPVYGTDWCGEFSWSFKCPPAAAEASKGAP
jgi:hypothetical protein